MADQAILNSGLTNLVQYIGEEFKYVAIGNGTWETTEKIPANTVQLKHEVYRTAVMNTSISDNKITIFAAFNGTNIVDPDTGIASLTEIGLTNTAATSSSQSMFLMKVFSAMTMAETDSKVIKIVINLQGVV